MSRCCGDYETRGYVYARTVFGGFVLPASLLVMFKCAYVLVCVFGGLVLPTSLLLMFKCAYMLVCVFGGLVLPASLLILDTIL